MGPASARLDREARERVERAGATARIARLVIAAEREFWAITTRCSASGAGEGDVCFPDIVVSCEVGAEGSRPRASASLGRTAADISHFASRLKRGVRALQERAMANAGGNGSGGDAGMSWLENFKPPSPARPEQPPPSYEASIRDDDPSETATASEIHPSSSAIEEASAARGDPPREAPEPETDAPVASGPSRRTSGTARPDSDLEPPRRAEPRGASPIAVPSVAEEEKREKREERKDADDDAATIRSLRSEVAVSAAAAEDASAALEAMSLKVDTLARLLDEASRERDEERRKRMAKEDDASDQSAKKKEKENEDASRDDVSAQLAVSESERAEFVSKVTRLETQVVSLSNDLRAAREIARSTGELADQSATYIAELKKKHRALETRERETRAELALKNAEARDVRKNTHDAKLETETFRVETNRLTETIVTLKKKLRAAEDALEDGRRESAGGAAARDELETLREEHRALLDAEKTFARRLRDAEDAAADAELRAADAELACEAVRADAAAELERETEKLLSCSGRRAPDGGVLGARAAEGEADEDDEDDARDDVERRAREAEARARALEAELRELRARREGAGAETSPSGEPLAPSETPRDVVATPDETDEASVVSSEHQTKLALLARAERAERALETARLLARPAGVTESDAELVRLRDAGRRAGETERLLLETRRKLDACVESKKALEASKRDEIFAAREAAESDARVLVARAEARARELFSEEREHDSAETSRSREKKKASDPDDARVREAHAKRVTLRFLEARTFDEQQAVLPVLAAVQSWDPSERRAVDKARAEYWEPAEKVLADRLSAAAEVDLGVTSAANALAGALGLGNVL